MSFEYAIMILSTDLEVGAGRVDMPPLIIFMFSYVFRDTYVSC